MLRKPRRGLGGLRALWDAERDLGAVVPTHSLAFGGSTSAASEPVIVHSPELGSAGQLSCQR